MITTLHCKDMVDLLKQDEYINDMMDIKINSTMSISTLYALEMIFFLRLQLAQVSWDANETLYENICHDRFEQILKVLIEKYRNAKSINEKIEILERIEIISLNLNNDHSFFALEEASIIEDGQDLTYAQKLRLKWLPGLTLEDDSKIVAELLPQTDSSFEMATLALIIDFCSNEKRYAIFDRYLEMFDTALSANNTAEIGNLLSLAAYWNIFPFIRPTLTKAANQAVLIKGLSLPEKRVNPIAAGIYTRIDILTGKYVDIEEIPA